ncbi:ANTAR domain-containing protein [Streptomyces sp. SID12501]|uniref:ANTAR domain-containing protein n=1 Tax=Streptomyces sp. SID12501 TaxID=2706042 RepID=A0A6B3C1A6_9ACTN|nr:ANTAR domain-containing protein [Streptomyces sp. SID12501]NEC90497.1 ANTAR domain-containing protein [Streptomyces sp. SID12501]
MSDRAVTTQLTVADEVRPAPLLGIETRPAGYATLVVVTGAIDLVTEQSLHNGLSQALARSERAIELDLSGVDFCDCSGLNVLLRVRKRALDEGKIITIRSAGTAMLRLFAITGTLPLFAGPDDADEPADASGAGESGRAPDTRPAVPLSLGTDIAPLDETDQDLRIEVVQLRRAMQTRPVIDLARGVLMASFGLSAEDAWNVLVAVSQNTNTKLHEVADNLIGAVTGDALPEALRLQIAKTVAGLRALPEDPSPPGPHP